jgi:hypothetical protein
VLLSLVPKGLAVLKLIWGGRIPVKTLFSVHSLYAERMARVLAREQNRLPPRPKAIAVERDEAVMNCFLDAALVDLKAVGEGKLAPGAVDRLDVEKLPPRPLSLFTRLAGTVSSAPDYIRALDRTKNTPG